MGQQVALSGVAGGKALVNIDGAAPRFMTPGQTHQGVKLLSTQDLGQMARGAVIGVSQYQNIVHGVLRRAVCDKGQGKVERGSGAPTLY